MGVLVRDGDHATVRWVGCDVLRRLCFLLGMQTMVQALDVPARNTGFSSIAEMQDFSTVSQAHHTSTFSKTHKKNPQTLDWTDQQMRQGGVPTKHLHSSIAAQKFAHPKYATLPVCQMLKVDF